MTDRKTIRAALRLAIVELYTVFFLGYSAWLFYRMVSRLTDIDDRWSLEPIGILLLAEMGVDEVLDLFYERGKVSAIQHWWSMIFNIAFFTHFRLYLDTEAFVLVKVVAATVLGSYWSLLGLLGVLLGGLWYWRLPERTEGFIRLP